MFLQMRITVEQRVYTRRNSMHPPTRWWHTTRVPYISFRRIKAPSFHRVVHPCLETGPDAADLSCISAASSRIYMYIYVLRETYFLSQIMYNISP